MRPVTANAGKQSCPCTGAPNSAHRGVIMNHKAATILVPHSIHRIMKLAYSVTVCLLSILLLTVGCTSSGSKLEEKRQELAKLQDDKKNIETRIAELEKEVNAMAPDTGKSQREVPVKVEAIAPSTFEHYITVQGMVTSDKLAMVSPKLGGVITRIHVQAGDKVSAGQVLAEMDNNVAMTQLQGLQTQYDFAKTVYEKQKRVWEQQAGSEIEYLRAKNTMESLEKQIATAKEQVDMSKIRAPFAGVVDKVVPKVGESVAPGVEAFRVVNLSNLRVEANVSESYLGNIQRGDEAKIEFPDMGQQITAKVATVAQAVDSKDRTFTVTIPLSSAVNFVRPNMISVVRINDMTRENALVVPLNAVQNVEGKNYLYIAEQTNKGVIARRREVSTGLIYEGKVEVLSGITAGDKVVVLGMTDIEDGDSIKLM